MATLNKNSGDKHMNKVDGTSRVLIVSNNAFSSVYNNGKTYEALFSGFPKKTIAQLFFNHNEDPDFEFCNNYFKITDTDVLKNIFSLHRNHGGQLQSDKTNSLLTYFDTKKPPIVGHGNTRLFLLLKSMAQPIAIFRDFLWKLNTWKTRKLFKWIEDFAPTSIFLIVGSSGYPQEVVRYLCKKYTLPLIIFFTDDYIINPIPVNLLDRIQRWRMQSVYWNTIKMATLCFGIGEKMCNEYSTYFKKNFYPIMNTIQLIPYSSSQKRNSAIKISFFGGLQLNRWKMISDLGGMLREVYAKFNVKTELYVYSVSELSPEIVASFNENDVIYKGCAYGDELSKALSDADILLHVESDDTYYRRLTRLSVSTKIPEYLITGKLVLAYGPPEVASISLLFENKIGVVISSDESRDITINKLKEILTSDAARIHIGKQGYDYAKEKFNREKVQKMFMEKIYSVSLLPR